MNNNIIIDVAQVIEELGYSLEETKYTASKIAEMMVEDVAEKGLATAEGQKELLADLLYGLSIEKVKIVDDPLPDYATEAIAGAIAQNLIAVNKVKAELEVQLATLKQQNELMKEVLKIIAYETMRPFNPRHLAEAALNELEK